MLSGYKKLKTLLFLSLLRGAQLASIRLMSGQVSRGSAGEYQAVYLEPGVFSERCTEKLPLRVDFIHRVEFGEVSGHRVLIKRGQGNRGPAECGTTHEATSGMSS